MFSAWFSFKKIFNYILRIIYFTWKELLKTKKNLQAKKKLSKQKFSHANETKRKRQISQDIFTSATQINDFNSGETNKFSFNVDCGFALMLHFFSHMCNIFFSSHNINDYVAKCLTLSMVFPSSHFYSLIKHFFSIQSWL